MGKNVTLTINPGVTLNFATTDIMYAGLDTARAELQVAGSLAALGTAAQPIVMTSSGAGASSWYGINFFPAATNTTLQYVNVDKTSTGLFYQATAASVSVQNSSFSTSSYGMEITSPTSVVNNTTIASAGTGIYYSDGGGGTLSNSIVRNCTNYGVYVYTNTATNPSLNIVGSTLNANGSYGVYAQATSGLSTAVTIKNSNITNHSTGIYRYTGSGNPSVTVTYSNVWKNSTNYSNVVGGVGTFSSNPSTSAPPTCASSPTRPRASPATSTPTSALSLHR